MAVNKRKITFWSIIFLIIGTPFFMYLAWCFSPLKPMRFVLIDKTVNNENCDEHSPLNWVLDHDKYVKFDSSFYEKKKDYYGFFPQKNEKFEIKDFETMNKEALDQLVLNNDVIFYNDAYGVYSNEWNKKPKINERSLKIYGGATMKEAYILKKAKESKKLIITEFNLLASPTPENVRKSIEETLNFKWTGWVGRYYDILDTTKNKDLPGWLKTNYLKQHNNKWPFKKSGLIFVRNDDHIEILEYGTHLNNENLMIYTQSKHQSKYNLPAEIKFNFWFDIISTTDSNRVVSTYKIDATTKGKKILDAYNIPLSFPATIESVDQSFYYMAGDFSDNKINEYSCYFKGVTFFKDFFFDSKDKTAREYFFWNYYQPFMRKVFDNRYLSKQ
jgi:hypothetical protein